MMWNIRKIVRKGDYLYAVVPEHPNATRNGYVLAHRVVMENCLGRMLERNEEVHHIDENKKNNSPENLEIKLTGEHQRFHSLRYPSGHKILMKCSNCNQSFEREHRNRHDNASEHFCKPACYYEYLRKNQKKVEGVIL